MKGYMALILILASSSLHSNELGLLTSTLELESIDYTDDFNQSSDLLHQVSLSATYSNKITENSRIVITPKFRRSNSGGIKDKKRLNEGFIDWRFQDSDIRVGIQKFSWGRTDIVNPTDFSISNFQDPLDADNEGIGQFSFSRRSYHEHADLEVLWVPLYNSSELPDEHSPWFPTLPTESPQGQSIHYQISGINKPDQTIKNSQFGIRLTGSENGIDFGVSYFSGWNDLPVYQQSISTINSEIINIDLNPSSNRINVLGLEVASSLADYTLRTELAYVNTADDNGTNALVDDSYLHGVLGIDKQFTNAILSQDIRILLEWSYQHSTTSIEYAPTDLDHIFENTVFVRMSTDQAPSWEAQLDLVYDMENEGQFIRPSFNFEIIDDFKISIMLEWMKGTNRSFFGTYENNKSIRVRFSKDSLLF